MLYLILIAEAWKELNRRITRFCGIGTFQNLQHHPIRSLDQLFSGDHFRIQNKILCRISSVVTAVTIDAITPSVDSIRRMLGLQRVRIRQRLMLNSGVIGNTPHDGLASAAVILGWIGFLESGNEYMTKIRLFIHSVN